MAPVLFHIGNLPVYSFGLMLAIGFITGSYLLTIEYNRMKINKDITDIFIFNMRVFYSLLIIIFFITFYIQNSGTSNQSFFDFIGSSTLHLIILFAAAIAGFLLFKKPDKGSFDLANGITLISLIFGIAGSKVLYIIENMSDFIARPLDTMFSAGGLTFYGGFILVVAVIYYTTRKAGISFLLLTDATAPGLMLSYGIARIGCHLAGDGDYGFPTTLPWGTDYSKGTYPPSAAFRDFPEISNRFPGGIVPDHTPCHPTPVYEFIICALMFWILWRIRKKISPPGKLFMIYLVLAGIERFSIEFIRINYRIFLGLSEAQIIAIIIIAIGLIGWWKISKSAKTAAAK